MKKALITIALLMPVWLFAQVDTSKITSYCEMVASGKLLSNKITIDLDFGEGKSGWSFKNTSLRDEVTGKIKKFNSVVDALNYMGIRGWKLVNAFPISESGGMGGTKNVLHFFFSKEFDKSEFVATPVE